MYEDNPQVILFRKFGDILQNPIKLELTNLLSISYVVHRGQSRNL